MGSIVTSPKVVRERPLRDRTQNPTRPLTNKQSQLAAENLKLARFVVNRFRERYYEDIADSGITTRELLSAAHLGLCRAARDFKHSKGYQFSTYAFPSCYRAVANELRGSFRSPQSVRVRTAKAMRAKRELLRRGERVDILSIAKEAGEQPSQIWNDFQFNAECGATENCAELETLDYREKPPFDRELFRVAFKGLSKKERVVLLLRLVEEMEYQEIGNHFGVSRQAAHTTFKRACEKIRGDKLKMELLREWMKP